MNPDAPIRVGLADDHLLFRQGIAAILSAASDLQVVIEAANGAELLAAIPEAKPDVVLVDLEMPVMDGMETIKSLRNTYPDLPAMVLSMYEGESFMRHLMECGASGYLLKNTEPEELEQAIRQVVKTGFYINAALGQAMLSGLRKKERSKPTIPGHSPLSEREREVLELICQELTSPEIAEKLFLSVRTVEGHRKQLLEKTGARNTAGLVLWAVREGMIE